MAKITKEFTYNLADDYLVQTTDLGKTATWTYEGPDEIWVEVEKETGKLVNTGFKTLEEDGPDIPTPPETAMVRVDCASNPLFCCLVGADDPKDYATLPQYSENLPNGNVYERPEDPTPDHTYDVNTAVYDWENDEWSYNLVKTWVTWDQIISRRNLILKEIKREIAGSVDAPESYRTALESYKTELENLEITWAGYEEDHQCIKVQMPEHPFNG